MLFSENGYFLDRYHKCSVTGTLIYGEPPVRDGARLYASEWARAWGQ